MSNPVPVNRKPLALVVSQAWARIRSASSAKWPEAFAIHRTGAPCTEMGEMSLTDRLVKQSSQQCTTGISAHAIDVLYRVRCPELPSQSAIQRRPLGALAGTPMGARAKHQSVSLSLALSSSRSLIERGGSVR